MNTVDVVGLSVGEALEILSAQGISAKVEYTKPPFPQISTLGRTPRVVATRGNTLIAAYFLDGIPEEKDGECK